LRRTPAGVRAAHTPRRLSKIWILFIKESVTKKIINDRNIR
jgi:hypothetical protein